MLGATDCADTARELDMDGDRVVIAGWNGNVVVVDVFDPQSPTVVGVLGGQTHFEDVSVPGTLAGLAGQNLGLAVLGVANTADPVIVGWHDTDSTTRAVAIAGAHAYLADGETDIRAISIANPASTVQVGQFDRGAAGDMYDIAVVGTIAYLAEVIAELRLRVGE